MKEKGALNRIHALNDISNHKRALTELQEIVYRYPDITKAWLALAQRYQQSGELQKSLDTLYEAKNLFDESTRVKLAIVQIEMELKHWHKAEAIIVPLARQHPEKYNFAKLLVKVYNSQSKYDNAIKIAKLHFEKNQDNYKSVLLYVRLLNVVRDHNEALSILKKELIKFPQDVALLKENGFAEFKKSNFKKAEASYDEIIKIDPKYLKAYIELSNIYRLTNRSENALTLLEQAHASIGFHHQILMQIAAIYQSAQIWDQALYWFRKAHDNFPDNLTVCSRYAYSLFINGKSKAAFKVLKETQEKFINSEILLYREIELKSRVGRFQYCENLLKLKLNESPTNERLLELYLRLSLTKGEYAKAANLVILLEKNSKNNAEKIERYKAEIEIYQFNYHKAEIHYRRVIDNTSDTKVARNRLAAILMLTSRNAEAMEEFKTAALEIKENSQAGEVIFPLKSHVARINNELRINEVGLQELLKIKDYSGFELIKKLGSLMKTTPDYFGYSLYLAKELRVQKVFDKLQKYLSTSTKSSTNIPKRIMQYWDSPKVPKEINRISKSWRKNNPEYEYERFTYGAAKKFIAHHFEQEVLIAFKNCEHPATQSDLFRLAYLFIKGGIYSDMDDMCRKPMDFWLKTKPELIVLQEELSCLGNNFIAAIPNSSIIKSALDIAVRNLLAYRNEGPWFETGPAVLTQAVCNAICPFLNDKSFQNWPRVMVLSQAQLRDRIYQHVPLSYKKTDKSWYQKMYGRITDLRTNLVLK